MNRSIAMSLLAIALCVHSTAVLAQTPAQVARRAAGVRVGVQLGASAGEITPQRLNGGHFGVAAYGHYSIFQVGALIEYVSQIRLNLFEGYGRSTPAASCVSLAGAAGLRFETRVGRGAIRYDLLGVAGVHLYDEVYPHYFAMDPTSLSPALAFLGVRGGVAYEWSGRPHFALGLQGFWESDVEFIKDCVRSPIYDGRISCETISGRRAGAVLTFEIAFDFTQPSG